MVRVALHEKGFEYQHKIIKLCDHYDDADNLSKEFLSDVNPTGVVPVLKINNEFIRDSAYIIEKLDEFATYTDSLDEIFENKEQIEVSKFYERLPKPQALAVQEWLEDKIYFRNTKSN